MGHNQSGSRSQPWQCPLCPYSAPVDSLLPQHIRTEHPDQTSKGDD
jgi:hypothetical protein